MTPAVVLRGPPTISPLTPIEADQQQYEQQTPPVLNRLPESQIETQDVDAIGRPLCPITIMEDDTDDSFDTQMEYFEENDMEREEDK